MRPRRFLYAVPTKRVAPRQAARAYSIDLDATTLLLANRENTLLHAAERLADLCLWSAESSRTESLLVRVRRLFATNLCLLHASSDEFPNAIIERHKVWRVPRKVRPSERCRAFRNTIFFNCAYFWFPGRAK